MNTTAAPVVFNGEWLWLGNLGHAFVILSFVASLLSAIFYFQHEQNKLTSGLSWGKRFFQIHAAFNSSSNSAPFRFCGFVN
jgi:hypothetical protein